MNIQTNDPQVVTAELQKIIGAKNADKQTIQKNMEYLDKLAKQYNYQYKNPEIQKLENTIQQFENLSKKSRNELIDFFLSQDFRTIIDGLGELRNEILSLAKNEMIGEAKSDAPAALTRINKINLPLDITPSLRGTMGKRTEQKRKAADRATTTKLFRENVNFFIDDINNMVNILSKIDPNYRDQINNMSDNFEVERLDFDPMARGMYPYTPKTVGKRPIKFGEINNYIDVLNDLQKLKDKSTDATANAVFAVMRDWRTISGGEREHMVKFLTKILDKVNADADRIIGEKFTEQTGGTVSDLTNQIILIVQRYLVLLQARELLDLMGTIKPEPVRAQQQQQTDYTQPLIALLTYRIGYLNNYDISLINYCKTFGLDSGTILAIYFSDRRKDIEEIVKIHIPHDISAVMRILQLKKLSAELKFRINYDIKSDSEILILNEKKLMWPNIIL